MNKNKLLSRLDEVALRSLDKAAFKALLRLQVYFTGRTHELLIEFGKQAQAVLLKWGDEDGVLDGVRGYKAQMDLIQLWSETFSTWQSEFLSARREAVSLPYGVLAVRHERLVRPVASEQLSVNEGIASASPRNDMVEAIEDGVFKPQIEVLLKVAEEYLYGDGITLDGRIWRIDAAGREAINNVIMQGIADGDSAWNIAKKLEGQLGAGQDCPRWTSTRLYGRTVQDRAAGDPTGLLSGNDCDGRGVSYKALRLARTEIQKIHSLATDRLMEQQPWVGKEKCNLSEQHKEPDECDDVIAGGEDGKGIYPVGTIEYPLHPLCFCYKTAVLMDEKEFTDQMNGWLNGEAWSEMDEYANTIGVDTSTSLSDVSLMPSAVSLAVWLFSDELKGLLK
jgi:hypothetical protein